MSNVPDVPHLVLIDGPNTGIAIVPGSRLLLVEDASNPEKQFPFVLRSVSHTRIVLTLGGTDYTYKLTSGRPRTLEAVRRMKESRGDLK